MLLTSSNSVTSVSGDSVIGVANPTTTPSITHSTADGSLHVPIIGTTSLGKVLTAGATAGAMSWETPAGAGSSVIDTEFVATAGQTVFTVAYTVGTLDVYLNGIMLASSDYTALNGTSVTLNVGATVGDIITTKSYSTFDVANAYTKAEVDARTLDNISNVIAPSPAVGETITWNGTNWVNGAGGGVPILQPEGVATITHYAPLSISGNTGARLLIRICDLSDGKQLVITCGNATSTSTECYGTVYNPVANTWGAPTLLFTGASTSIASENAISIKTIGTDRFMLVNVNSLTELQAKVLTVSGSTITVGTAYTQAVTIAEWVITQVVSAGSSYVIGYKYSSSATAVLAMTESAGVVTFGAVVFWSVTNSLSVKYLFPISTTEVGIIYSNAAPGTVDVRCLTLSGATITASTPLVLGGSSYEVLYQKIGAQYVVISQETGQARISFLQFAAGAVTARSLVIIGSFHGITANSSIVNVGAGKYICVLAALATYLPNKAVYISDDGTTVTNITSIDFSDAVVTMSGILSSSATDIAELVLSSKIIRFTYIGGSIIQSLVSFSKNAGASNIYVLVKGENRAGRIFNKMKTLTYNKTTYSGFSIDALGAWSIVDFSSFPSYSINQMYSSFHELGGTEIGYAYANLGHYLYIIKGDLT